MSQSKKNIIYNGAFFHSDITSNLSLTDFAYKILTNYGSIAENEALEYVARYERSIINNFKMQNDELKRRGISIIGNIDVGDRISWSSTNEKYKLVWKMRPIFLKFIESLSDEKFEALCCVCINLMGGKVWRTKSKGDGNIDLYAVASTNMDNHIFGKSTRFRIVGQCKNYSHQESVTNFEAFLHAMSNVRHQAVRVTREMPNEFIRENGPIIGWYICKDGFQKGSFEEARKHGIVLSDKYDLVEILIKLNLEGVAKNFRTLCLLNLSKQLKNYISVI